MQEGSFPMTCPEICDVAARALVEIQDTADLILLDLLEGRESGGAATRFAAIQQYASRAMEHLAYLAENKPRSLPPDVAKHLRERCRPLSKAFVHAQRPRRNATRPAGGPA